jgi:hypothetical protein
MTLFSLSLSLSYTHVQRGILYWFGLDFHLEGGREEKLNMQLLQVDFGKRKGHLLSLFAFILPIK